MIVRWEEKHTHTQIIKGKKNHSGTNDLGDHSISHEWSNKQKSIALSSRKGQLGFETKSKILFIITPEMKYSDINLIKWVEYQQVESYKVWLKKAKSSLINEGIFYVHWLKDSNIKMSIPSHLMIYFTALFIIVRNWKLAK